VSWRYEQSTGALINAAGEVIGEGYSGAPTARNDPAQQAIMGIGPIPRGLWYMAAMMLESEHGPYAIVLLPRAGTITFGRTGFLMHGDNIHLPGTASHGCIIQDHPARVAAWTSSDHDLEVV
jgi:hypothetical protein